MRIALYGRGGFGVRIARVLLAERHLERLGLVGETVRHPRVETVAAVSDYDVAIIDEIDDRGREVFEEALATRTDLVVAGGVAAIDHSGSAIVANAASVEGLAYALATETRASVEEAVEVSVAWTTQGRPLRRGQAVTFPDPVGARWAEPVGSADPTIHRALAAPGEGPWAGALTNVTAATTSGLQTITVAIVDDRSFLSAAMVAGAAMAAAEGAYGVGVRSAADPSGAFLRAVRRAGVTAASFTRM